MDTLTPRSSTDKTATQRIGVRPSLTTPSLRTGLMARISAALLAAGAVGGSSGCFPLDHGGGNSEEDTAQEDGGIPVVESCDGRNERIAPKVVPIENSCRIDGGTANISFDVPEFDECRAPLTVILYAAIQTQGKGGELRTNLVPLDAPIVAYEAGQYDMTTSIGTGAILYLVLEVTDSTGAKFRTAPFCSANAV
ncbi:MAG: hypothetical protein AAB606_03895 [Patescibacteria group bacterium]